MYFEGKDFTKNKRQILPKSFLLHLYPLNVIFTLENDQLNNRQIIINLDKKFIFDCEGLGLNILSSMESFPRIQVIS